jgi:signal transduction histidine kinase
MAVATTSMVVIAFVLPLGLLVREMAEQRSVNKATFEAQSLASVLAAVRDRPTQAQVVDSVRQRTTDDVSVFLPDGTIIGTPAPVDDGVAEARRGRAFTRSFDGGREVLMPVLTSGAAGLVVRVRVPGNRLHSGVFHAWLLLAAVGIVLIVVAVIVADRLARSIVGPIGALAATARELGRGDLDARVTPAGPQEVADVGHALNRLAARITALVAAERESLADLSHRLRTPLTALRLQADSIADPVAARDVGAAVDQLAAAVDSVITEARRPSSDVDSADVDSADAVAVVSERVEFWSVLADEQHRSCTVHLADGPLVVPVPPAALCDAVDALLGNVFAHTPDGAALEVSLLRVDGPQAVVRVDDAGAGFPDDAVLERGVSGGGSTGLGLDIAQRVAQRAGGRLQLSGAALGGARVELILPVGARRPAPRALAGSA